jgi:hypothetical protein
MKSSTSLKTSNIPKAVDLEAAEVDTGHNVEIMVEGEVTEAEAAGARVGAGAEAEGLDRENREFFSFIRPKTQVWETPAQ